MSIAAALAAIGGVLPPIEIVDSRVSDWRIKLVDTVGHWTQIEHSTGFAALLGAFLDE